MKYFQLFFFSINCLFTKFKDYFFDALKMTTIFVSPTNSLDHNAGHRSFNESKSHFVLVFFRLPMKNVTGFCSRRARSNRQLIHCNEQLKWKLNCVNGQIVKTNWFRLLRLLVRGSLVLPVNRPSVQVFRCSWWHWGIWSMWHWISSFVSFSFPLSVSVALAFPMMMRVASHVAHFHSICLFWFSVGLLNLQTRRNSFKNKLMNYFVVNSVSTILTNRQLTLTLSHFRSDIKWKICMLFLSVDSFRFPLNLCDSVKCIHVCAMHSERASANKRSKQTKHE